MLYRPAAPVACQVILEPGIGQFREFECPRVHTRTNSWVLFRVHKFARGKRESVKFATLNEKSTSGGIPEPYARQKSKAQELGGSSDDTCDNGLLSRS